MKPLTYKDAIRSTTVVLVEFFATWCPHCQKMMPVVAEVAATLQGQVPVYQYDIDEEKDLAEAEKVDSIPTFIIYRGGEPVWRHTGEIEGQALLSKVQEVARG